MPSSPILIVEDEAIVAKHVALSLTDMGYKVAPAAATAAEAMALAAKHKPKLALLDIRLREEPDGIETARMLREQFGTDVIYMTAHADEATLARARETQPLSYLVKPITEEALRSAITIAYPRIQRSREAAADAAEAGGEQALGVITRAMLHEMASPIAAVTGLLEMALRAVKTGAPVAREDVDLIDDAHGASVRIAELLAQLSIFSKVGVSDAAHCDVFSAATAALALAQLETRGQPKLTLSGMPGQRARADERLLVQTLLRMLLGAARSVKNAVATIELAVVAGDDEVCVELRLHCDRPTARVSHGVASAMASHLGATLMHDDDGANVTLRLRRA